MAESGLHGEIGAVEGVFLGEFILVAFGAEVSSGGGAEEAAVVGAGPVGFRRLPPLLLRH